MDIYSVARNSVVMMLLAGSVYSVTLSSVLSLYKKKYFVWFSSSSESEGSKQLMSSGRCLDSIKLMSDGTLAAIGSCQVT